jgi:hypothetical protein
LIATPLRRLKSFIAQKNGGETAALALREKQRSSRRLLRFRTRVPRKPVAALLLRR